jgi:hypothetical protein
MPVDQNRAALIDSLTSMLNGMDIDALSDADLSSLLSCLQNLSVAQQSESGPGQVTSKKFSARRFSARKFSEVRRPNTPVMSEARKKQLMSATPAGKAMLASRKR